MNKLSSLHVLTVCLLMLLLALPLLMLLLALPVSIRLAPESYDYVQHQLFALVWASEGTLPGPHFLYQALLLGVQALLPVANLPTIAVAINAVALISTGLLVFGLLYAALPRSQSAIGALALTVVLLLAAPASFPSWHSGVYYLSYISPNSYHNPTIWLISQSNHLADETFCAGIVPAGIADRTCAQVILADYSVGDSGCHRRGAGKAQFHHRGDPGAGWSHWSTWCSVAPWIGCCYWLSRCHRV